MWKRKVMFILAALTFIYSSSIIILMEKNYELIMLDDKPIIVDKTRIVDTKEQSPSISSSDEYAVGKRMFRLVDQTIHQHITNNNSTSYLNLAIESCDKEYYDNEEYPTIYKNIAIKRRTRWKRAEEVNIIQMINDKLGGLYYATKLGVLTPRILFCGLAKDLPKDINTLGKKYVVKPLSGHSAQGVKVIVDGVNTLNNNRDDDEEFSYNTLVEEYGSQEETIVEELIESADPKYNGLIPPDYKFHVYGGKVPEILLFIDRNKGQKCEDHFDVTSSKDKWKVIEELPLRDQPHCPKSTLYSDTSRETAMMDAVRKVAIKASKNWLRIDMYDSINGPVFGEITPWSSNGLAAPRASCVMSYLFTAHAYNNEDLDDAATVNELKRKFGLETFNSSGNHDDEFHPPEANQWKTYTQMEKCNKVMKAQEEFIRSNR